MARREDYLLSRMLLTDGTVSPQNLSNILLKWHVNSPKSLLQTIIDDGLVTDEEGQGLTVCIDKLTERVEHQDDLDKIDFILCQIAIKRNFTTPEVVTEYRKKLTGKKREGLSTSELLVQDNVLTGKDFIELKRAAEQIFYHRRIVALARGKEKTKVFLSPGRFEEQGKQSSSRRSAAIQKALSDVRAEKQASPAPKRKRGRSLPKEFGAYEILGEIASGGMGTVYQARHKKLDRILALKVLNEENETPERIKRFLREADAASRLRHPNIVSIYEAGDFKGRHFFSMDYIDGVPLSVLIQKRKNVDLEDLLNIAAELSRAIHYAHEQGIIHRDLKPANIIIDMEGHPQITDFGLAKIMDSRSRLTKSDTIIGTPFYMAPEQTRGENHSIRATTDIWGVGVILYEMITKKLPFVGRSSIELYHKINNLDPIPPSKINPLLTRELDYIVLRCISKDVEDRFPSAEALATYIENYLDGKPIAIRETPMWWRKLRRFFKRHKWFILVAISAIILGWACGWYLLTKIRN
ncbi:serine/threonine protein kinase [Candidatus Uabimicrobium amorphum]|uniref:Protein kinase n=1 Tax=Uabimicrobium amorphum TaxID=2596890 RepID=A0A5S9IRI8_UABAM|nr:serine/threonine-protein kinase [Candidatus Uabimicrobium amorphum]BBM86803.1 protein kinase [Candidatus Uabimicrobium amorphum]